MKLRKLYFLLVLIPVGIVSCIQKNNNISAPGELDLRTMMQLVPRAAKFINDSSFTWGASMIRSESDDKYHLFYSRWPRKFGMNAWVSHSEIAHAVSDSPEGPFSFKDVALPPRGAEYWDGMVTHNPTIRCFDNKYYLYYMGNRGDGKLVTPELNWTHRNNQRIGVAVADDPNGPWQQFDAPIIDVSPDSTAHDALMTSNPSVTNMPDGRYLAVYKAVAKKKPMPFGGPVVHLTAIADSPTGPFVKQNKPVFVVGEDVLFPAEDPYVWYQDNCFYAIVKDQNSYFVDAGRSLVLFYSLNGLDWKLASHPLISTLQIQWSDSLQQGLEAVERPQLYLENGKPKALCVAVKEGGGVNHSFNVQIPLK
jgi:hypothetical protein